MSACIEKLCHISEHLDLGSININLRFTNQLISQVENYYCFDEAKYQTDLAKLQLHRIIEQKCVLVYRFKDLGNPLYNHKHGIPKQYW